MTTSVVIEKAGSGGLTMDYAGGDHVLMGVKLPKGESQAQIPIADLVMGINVIRKAQRELQELVRKESGRI